MDRRDDKLAREVARGAGEVGHTGWGNRLPERGLGLSQDLRTVGDHEHPRRPVEGLAVGDHIEGREPGFAKAGGHGDEGFRIAVGPDRGEGCQGFTLPGAGRKRYGRRDGSGRGS